MIAKIDKLDRVNSSYVILLNKIKLFEGFTESECTALYDLLKPSVKEFAKSEILINEGERFDEVGVVYSGRLSNSRIYYEGNVHLLSILTRGDLIGLETVTSPSRKSPVTVTAIENSTIMMFSYDRIMGDENLAQKHKERLTGNIIKMLANENIKQMYKVEVLSKRGLRERIITFFTIMAKKAENNTFHIRMNREELAQYLCVNRSALSYELNEMKREGLIEFEKDRFKINFDYF